MATVKIFEDKKVFFASNKNFAIADFSEESGIVKPLDKKHETSYIKQKKYPEFSIKKDNTEVKIEEFLPFRIKFTNITIPGYSPTNVPPIGIAIIGFNNYIL